MAAPPSSPLLQSLPQHQTWLWKGWPIRYQSAGSAGPAVVLIHGFGAHSDHWRHNLPALGKGCRVFALDLIGFGGSAKPKPGAPLYYRFETWAEQVADFIREVVGEPVFLAGNSIGAVVSLQVGVLDPSLVRGMVLLNCSLRLLHERNLAKGPWIQKVTTPWIQTLLGIGFIGRLFFRQIAQPKALRRILQQAYGDNTSVTDELVQLLLLPAKEENAADVFLAFISYSQGPLPQDLLPQVQCPVLILWGSEDPWEPLDLGRQLAQHPAVDAFIPLPGVGHCPQDEAPDRVNPLLMEWILRHSAVKTETISAHNQ